VYGCWERRELVKGEQLEEYFVGQFSSMNMKIPGQSELRDKIKLIENKTVVAIPLKTSSVGGVLASG
jgi:hypothetical protein